MTKLIDRKDVRYGRWVVKARAANSVFGQTMWETVCDCGNRGLVCGSVLGRGKSLSCGCLSVDRFKEMLTTHGESAAMTPTYVSWKAMHTRATNLNIKGAKNYAGRGITVCERWEKYENFLVDMGERPEGLTLERRDVNKNYTPNNCYWASREAQANNRRDTVKYPVDGVLLSLTQLSRYWSISRYQVAKKLKELQIDPQRIY